MFANPGGHNRMHAILATESRIDKHSIRRPTSPFGRLSTLIDASSCSIFVFRSNAVESKSLQTWTLTAGQVIARYSVALFFLMFGLMKFTVAEATAIHPLLVNSPFLFWLPRLFDQMRSSQIIGVVEIALALMMASRPFTPRISAIGSYGAAASLVITLSFLFTTPQLDPALGGFIIKDLTLLGVALWSAGDALRVAGLRIPGE
jgi:reactive chlorine resistance protein C